MKTTLKRNNAAFSFLLILAMHLPTVVTAQENGEKMIPSSAMAAIFLKPKDALAQPGMELIPHEIITAVGKEEFGFDPCQITQVVVLIDTIADTDNPPDFGVIIRFDEPQEVAPKLVEKMNLTLGELNGMQYFLGPGGMKEALLQKDKKTYIFGFERFIQKMLSASGARSSLIDQITANPSSGHFDAFVSIEPVRGFIKLQLAEQLPSVDQLPPPFRDFVKLPDLIDSFSFNSSFSRGGSSRIQVNAVSESAAKEIESVFRQGLSMAKQYIMATMAAEMRDQPPAIRESMMAYLKRIGNHVEEQFNPTINGTSMVLDLSSGDSAQLANVGTIGVLVGMLLPAVQQVREAARRTQAANNLRQLGLAALNYESAYQKFPAQANYSKDGKPLLSWRVHLLPYLDYGNVYEQFKLDEPWDSEHNIKLLDQMPPVFKSPNSAHTNKSTFLGISGNGTMFDGAKASTLGNVTDGTSNTLFFVEVNDDAAILWTKPGDYELNPSDPMWGLIGVRPGGFNASFVDGSVRFISHSVDIETLKRLMLKSDGQVVNYDF